jgi:hypothetical protein
MRGLILSFSYIDFILLWYASGLFFIYMGMKAAKDGTIFNDWSFFVPLIVMASLGMVIIPFWIYVKLEEREEKKARLEYAQARQRIRDTAHRRAAAKGARRQSFEF